MPEAQRKRCFQCGDSFSKDELTCPKDGAPLTFELIGRRWRVESLLARRPGGGVFSVTHTISGTRAVLDLVPWPLTEDHALGGRLHREVQALRLLDQQPHVPPFLETGTDSDGSRFLVTRITDIQPLPTLLQARGPLSPARAAAILQPVLSTLGRAHRLGVGHGQLGALWIFAAPGPGNEPDERLFLRGLVSLSEGQVRQPLASPQVQEDLRAAGALLHELITGRPIERNLAILDLLADRRVKDLLTRALGPEGFPSAEAFSRALSALADAPAAAAAAAERTTTQASVLGTGPGPVQIDAARMSGMLPLLRKRRATNQALPLPLAPLPAAPLRGGFTHELRQVSLLDMMDQEERSAPASPPQETLAVARNRPFTTADLPQVSSPPLPWSDEADEAEEIGEAEDMEIEVSFSPLTRPGPPDGAPQATAPAPAQVQAPPPAPRSAQTPAPPRSAQTPAPRSAQTPAPPRSAQTPASLPPSVYTPAPAPAPPPSSGLTPAAAAAWPPPAWASMPPPAWTSPMPAPPTRKGLFQSPLFWLLFGMTFAALVGLILLILLRPGLSRF